MDTLSNLNPTALRVLTLTVIFLVGYFESAVLKLREMACATWFTGLGGLTVLIIFPSFTTVRICIGALVFVSGLVLLVVYYKKAGTVPKS